MNPFRRREQSKQQTSTLPNDDRGRESDPLQVALDFASSLITLESDRENNLNTRATAVAAAAGLILTLAAAIAKTTFREAKPPWSDLAVASYVLALAGVAIALVVAVLRVLRPRKPGTIGRKALSLDFSLSWVQHQKPRNSLRAEGPRLRSQSKSPDLAGLLEHSERMRHWALDKSLEALASWWTRNLDKQNALRLSYFFFAVAVFFFAITGGALLIDEIFGTPTATPQTSSSPASNAEAGDGVEVSWLAAAFLLVGVFAYLGAWTYVRGEQDDEELRDYVAAIEDALQDRSVREPFERS